MPKGPGAKGQCQGGAAATRNPRKESGHLQRDPDKPQLSQVRVKPGEGQGARADLRLTLGLFCVFLKVAKSGVNIIV